MKSELKALAESILSDIANDATLANILLKTKVFAAKIHDMEMLNWVSDELNGYKDKIPEYRKIKAGIKVDLRKQNKVENDVEFPMYLLNNYEELNKLLSYIPVSLPISEIESMRENNGAGVIFDDIPSMLWCYTIQYYRGGIRRAYQYSTVAAVCSILVFVKSLLLDYFLKISDNEEIKFSSLIKRDAETTINNINNINASIVNTGGGSINTGAVSSVVGNGNNVDTCHTKEISEILAKLDTLMEIINSAEYNEISADIKSELKREVPSNKFLKRCFQAIGGLVTGVTSGVVANQISPLVSSALALL